MPVLSKRIVVDCFYLLIFYFEKFSTDVCRLPCAVNVNLNLSIYSLSPSPFPFKNVVSMLIKDKDITSYQLLLTKQDRVLVLASFLF